MGCLISCFQDNSEKLYPENDTEKTYKRKDYTEICREIKIQDDDYNGEVYPYVDFFDTVYRRRFYTHD